MCYKMKILLIDNYDSFTFNLYQYLTEISDHEIEVFRNDKIQIEEVDAYDIIILSPGPGVPKDAGHMPAIIDRYRSSKPILGVCLGHQAIGESYGAELINLSTVYHGVDTALNILDNGDLFDQIPDGIRVGRYHSWSIKKGSTPEEIIITALDDEEEIMALRHRHDPVFGVQFHPESILTPNGKDILRNFLKEAERFINQTAS